MSSYIHDLKIGDMICAQHNAAGWYRCEIKGIKKLSDEDYDYEFDIYYVDFGDSAYIKSFEARMLLERFNELPCYGIQCTLNGVEPIEDDFWSNEAVDFFEDVTHSCKWVVLNAKLIASKEEFNKTIPISFVLIFFIDSCKFIHSSYLSLFSGDIISSSIFKFSSIVIKLFFLK